MVRNMHTAWGAAWCAARGAAWGAACGVAHLLGTAQRKPHEAARARRMSRRAPHCACIRGTRQQAHHRRRWYGSRGDASSYGGSSYGGGGGNGGDGGRRGVRGVQRTELRGGAVYRSAPPALTVQRRVQRLVGRGVASTRQAEGVAMRQLELREVGREGARWGEMQRRGSSSTKEPWYATIYHLHPLPMAMQSGVEWCLRELERGDGIL